MTDLSHGRMQIPMPTLLTDLGPDDLGNRDPQRSGDAGPIYYPSDNGGAGTVGTTEVVAAYARQLWVALDQVAEYLREQVARGGGVTSDEQWQLWQQAYAGVLSVLAGPAGDGGYGEQEARLEYQNRPQA